MPRDPYRNFSYVVEVDGFVRAGFNKVTGIKSATQVIEYREGGDMTTPRKLPGQTNFDPLVLSRGQSNDSDFISWLNEIFSITSTDGQGATEGWRRQIVLYLKDKSGARVKKWSFVHAWPSDGDYSDMDGSGNEVAMETLTIQHEGFNAEDLS